MATFPVVVGVELVAVGDVDAVVAVVLDSIFVAVVVVVADVTHQVVVDVTLQRVELARTVVALVTYSVAIDVTLVRVRHERTVVVSVEDSFKSISLVNKKKFVLLW